MENELLRALPTIIPECEGMLLKIILSEKALITQITGLN